MLKLRINPLLIIIFAFVLIIICAIHLMFGNCQSSYLHYRVQCFYVPYYLPKWFWVSNFSEMRGDGVNELTPYKDFEGKWYVVERFYWEDGTLSNETYGVKEISNYKDYNQDSFKLHGPKRCYDEDGKLKCKTFYINDVYGVYRNKPDDFIKWAEKVFRLLRKELVKVEINGYSKNIGVQTLSWLKTLEKPFKIRGDLIFSY